MLPAAAPWMVLAWLVILGAHGAYATRALGTGPNEFRAVALASLVTAGMVGMFCYLIQLPLSRGFVLLSFAIGTPCCSPSGTPCASTSTCSASRARCSTA